MLDWKVVVPSDAVLGGYYFQAINKDAPHPAAARLWEEFLYSDEGQNLWLEGGARPVRADAMTKAGTIDKTALARPAAGHAARRCFLTQAQSHKAADVPRPTTGPRPSADATVDLRAASATGVRAAGRPPRRTARGGRPAAGRGRRRVAARRRAVLLLRRVLPAGPDPGRRDRGLPGRTATASPSPTSRGLTAGRTSCSAYSAQRLALGGHRGARRRRRRPAGLRRRDRATRRRCCAAS